MHVIWKDVTECSVWGIWFVEREPMFFGIEDKISKLDEIIKKVLDRIKTLSEDNKDYFINTIKIKQNHLAELASKYREISKKFIENDAFYREYLFELYKKKYNNSHLLDFAERRTCLNVMNGIQILMKEKFTEYCNEYNNIRDSFFGINNFIIKVKKLFNIKD
jgi:hypothetical protein